MWFNYFPSKSQTERFHYCKTPLLCRDQERKGFIFSGLPYRKSTMYLSLFPVEIMTKILSFLPVKSVFRCRSVSKTLCSIIDAPQFVHMHLHSSTQTDDLSSIMLIPQYYVGELFVVGLKDSTALKMHVTCSDDSPDAQHLIQLLMADDFPNEEQYESHYYVVGASHGLLCLSSALNEMGVGSFCTVFICNPATKEYVMLPYLPAPDFLLGDDLVDVASGFAFDRSTNKFKVVKVFSSPGDELEVQIFTVGETSWRKVVGHANLHNDLQIDSTVYGASVVFVNGCFHWITQSVNLANLLNGNRESSLRIVSFDLERENFGVIPNPEFTQLPVNLRPINCDRFQLGVLEGCLCLSDSYYQKDRFEIWVMKEYSVRESWSRKYVIRKLLIPYVRIHLILPVFVRDNGEVVLICNSNFLVSYNPQNRTATPIEDDGLPRSQLEFGRGAVLCHAILYAGSLISPKSVCGAKNTYMQEQHA